MTNTLWMLKFANSDSPPSSVNKFFKAKHINFVKAFKAILETHNITLVYAGANGPYVTYKRVGSKLPTKEWDLTMVTDHTDSKSLSYDNLKKTKQFFTLCEQYPLSVTYTVPFKIKDMSSAVYTYANISQFISRFLGFFGNAFDITFGYFPPFPFKTASYDWLRSLRGHSGKDILFNIHKLTKYKDQPFFMLNLMQITDNKSDKKYTSGVFPLFLAVGARPAIVGQCKEYWNQILFAYYPNPKSFWEMSTSDNYVNKRMFADKSNSTKDVLVQATFPIYFQQKYCFGKMTSKL
eukprot:375595_1